MTASASAMCVSRQDGTWSRERVPYLRVGFMFWVHRNKGTWRDMRSALISFVRSLSRTGDGADGFLSAFALNGPAYARSLKPKEVSVRPTQTFAAT